MSIFLKEEYFPSWSKFLAVAYPRILTSDIVLNIDWSGPRQSIKALPIVPIWGLVLLAELKLLADSSESSSSLFIISLIVWIWHFGMFKIGELYSECPCFDIYIFISEFSSESSDNQSTYLVTSLITNLFLLMSSTGFYLCELSAPKVCLFSSIVVIVFGLDKPSGLWKMFILIYLV